MASRFLSDVGPSDEVRALISTTDVTPHTITLVLDKPRVLEVILKNAGKDTLTVRCRDIEDKTSVVLHLPYEPGARAQATIISYGEEH